MASFCLVCFFIEYKLNPNPIWIYVPHFIASIKASFYYPLNFRFSCWIGVLYYNISQYINIPGKGLRLSNFGNAFLHLNTGNSTMTLNPLSKFLPSAVFLVLYELCVVCLLYKRFVCVLYFLCCMKLSFFNFFFSVLLKLKAKRAFLDVSVFLNWVDPASNL